MVDLYESLQPAGEKAGIPDPQASADLYERLEPRGLPVADAEIPADRPAGPGGPYPGPFEVRDQSERGPGGESAGVIEGMSRPSSAAHSFMQGFGTTVAGVPKGAALVSAPDSEVFANLDRIDAGDPVVEQMQSPGGSAGVFGVGVDPNAEVYRQYQQSGPGNRQKIREQLRQRVFDATTDSSLYEAGQYIDKTFRENFPADPRYQDEFWTSKIPQALGSATGFILTSLATRGVARRIAPGSKTVDKASTYGAPMAAGAAVNSAELFEDALENGADVGTALEAAGYGRVIGLSEGLPIGNLLNRVDKASGGATRKYLRRAITQGTEEAAQEAFTGIMNSAIAQGLYDPERGIWTAERGEEAAVGFTTGALLETIMTLAIPGRRRGQAGAEEQGPDTGEPPVGEQVATGQARRSQGIPTPEEAAQDPTRQEFEQFWEETQGQPPEAESAPEAESTPETEPAPETDESDLYETMGVEPEPAIPEAPQTDPKARLESRREELVRLRDQASDPDVRADLDRQIEITDAEIEGQKPKLTPGERTRKNRVVRPEEDDLLLAIQKHGGIDTELETDWAGEFAGMRKKLPGLPGIERPGKGRALDDLAQVLHEEGYLSAHDKSELEDKLLTAKSGRPVYSMANAAAMAEQELEQQEKELDERNKAEKATEEAAAEVTSTQAERLEQGIDRDSMMAAWQEAVESEEAAVEAPASVALERIRDRARRLDEGAAERVIEDSAKQGMSADAEHEALLEVIENSAPRTSQVGGKPMPGVESFEEFSRKKDRGELDGRALGFLDLDNFKALNDTHGHEIGDEVIRRFGDTLRGYAGDGTVFRRSGDEFIVEGRDRDELEAALRQAQNDLEGQEIELDLPDGGKVDLPHLRFSLGAAAFDTSVDDTLKRAEEAQTDDKQDRKRRGLRDDRKNEGERRKSPGRRQEEEDSEGDRRGVDVGGREASGTAPDVQRGDDARAAGQRGSSEKQVDAFGGKSATEQAQKDADVERQRKADESPPMESGEGDLFSGKSRQSDIFDTPGVRPESGPDAAATSPNNDRPEPTSSQKEAGNYKLGTINVQGFDIAVENPVGSYRWSLDLPAVIDTLEKLPEYDINGETMALAKSREDMPALFRRLRTMTSRVGSRAKGPRGQLKKLVDDGWIAKMPVHYGYFRRTEGNDGDAVDVFVGPQPEAGGIWIMDQRKPDSEAFDEHKVLMGFESEEAALKAFRDSFEDRFGEKVAGPVTRVDAETLGNWLDNGDTSRPYAEQATSPSEEAESEETPAEETESDSREDTEGDSEPEVLSFEEFATLAGASRSDFGDAGLHKTHTRLSKKQWDRLVTAQARKDADLEDRRENLRKEYDRLVEAGKIRPPTRKERLERTAQGHPDNESVQAARRLLEKDKKRASRRGEEPAIDDFGARLEGARKFESQKLRDALAEDVDTASKKLSEVFPTPNYEKLAAEGVDREVLAFVATLRGQIPSKPRKAFKVRRWAAQVDSARSLADRMLSGEITMDAMLERARDKESPSLSVEGSILTARAMTGVPPELLPKVAGWRIRAANGYSMFDGKPVDPLQTFYSLETDRGGMTRISGPDPEAVIEQAREKIEAAAQKGASRSRAKYTKVMVYQNRDSGELFVGFKPRREVVKLVGGFKSVKEGYEYINANRDALQAQIDELRKGPRMRGDENAPREGPDSRVADVTPEDFDKAFGFRGVQFGNYVENSRRQQDINRAYDALHDMASVLDVPPKSLSLEGRLGLAFGARGKGGKNAAAAHYEPGQVVINLTKNAGPGSLAHEWLHSLDHWFGRRAEVGTFMTDAKKPAAGEIRPEVRRAWEQVMRSIDRGSFAERSKELDKVRSKDYFGTMIEKAARAFERYVYDKLSESGVRNDYLVNIDLSPEGPYPTAEEMDGGIREAFDELFNTLEAQETEEGIRLAEAAAPDYSGRDDGERDTVPGRERDSRVAEAQGRGDAGRSGAVQGELDFFAPARKADTDAAEAPATKLLDRRIINGEVGTYRSGLDKVRQVPHLGATDVAHIVAPLRKVPQEQVMAVVTDDDGKVLGILRHAVGGPSAASVYPSIILGAAADIEGASQVWMVHQHPSGRPNQSDADLKMTDSLTELADGSGLTIRGSVVVAPGGETTYYQKDESPTPDNATKIPAKRRDKKLPVYERQYRMFRPGGESLNASSVTRRVLSEYIPPGEEGLLLLDVRHHPVAVVPMSSSQMAKLRNYEARSPGESPSGRLLLAIHQTNAEALVARVAEQEPRMDSNVVANLKAFTGKFGIRHLDTITETGQSYAEKGLDLGDIRDTFFQRAPGLKSALDDTVRGLDRVADKYGMVSPKQAKAWLAARQKEGRFKAEELYWSGLNDYLDARDDKMPVAEIITFVKNNGVQVEESFYEEDEETPPDVSDVRDGLKVVDDHVIEKEDGERLIEYTVEHEFDDYTYTVTVDEDAGNVYVQRENGTFLDMDVPMNQQTEADGMRAIAYDIQQIEADRISRGSRPGVVGESEYGEYTLPGGIDYRELVLSIPSLSVNYTSGHYQEENNPVAQIRFKERRGVNGERILFIEEVQSDWAQEGRKRGFEVTDEKGRVFGVPRAPFVENTESWTALAMKRMVRYAAENGFDKIAWTDGETQAQRYDLSKRLSKVELVSSGTGRFSAPEGPFKSGRLMAYDMHGIKVMDQFVESAEQVEEYVGKDLADKIVNQEGEVQDDPSRNGLKARVRSASGIDLRIGGEGMRAYYDKILPSTTNKVLKKIKGPRVGTVELDEGAAGLLPDFLAWMEEKGYPRSRHEWEEQGPRFQEYIQEKGQSTFPGFEVTPEVSAAAMDGLPMFGRDHRGRPSSGIGSDRVQAVVDRVTDRWGNAPDFSVVEREADLPAGLRDRIGESAGFGQIRGAFWDGKVYLVAEAAPSEEAIEETILHETVGHYGLRGLLGNSHEQVMEEVVRSFGRRGLRKIAEEYGLDLNVREQRLEAAEEKIARMAEEGRTPSVMQRVVSAIKDALRKMGLRLRMTDADILRLLSRSRRFVEGGASTRGDQVDRTMFQNAEPAPVDMTQERSELIREGRKATRLAERLIAQYSSLTERAIEGGESPSKVMNDPAYDAMRKQIDEAVDRTEDAKQRLIATVDDSYIERGLGNEYEPGHEALFGDDARPLVELAKVERVAEADNDSGAAFQRGTDEFRRWFGDSKVVDENGNPKVVYHGTHADFSKFRVPAFFTDDPDIASQYAGGDSPSVVPAYVRIENPLVVENMDDIERAAGDFIDRDFVDMTSYAYPWEALEDQEIVDALERSGYDGVDLRDDAAPDSNRPHDSWVAFRPEQIKSATGNQGTYEPGNPDIRFQRAPAPDIYGTTADGQTAAVARYNGREWVVWERRDAQGNLFDDGPRVTTVKTIDQARERLQSRGYQLTEEKPDLERVKSEPLFTDGFDELGPEAANHVYGRARDAIDRVRYYTQDRYIDLKRLQGAVEESTGKPLADDANSYMGEALYHGRAEQRVEAFREKDLKPLLKEISDAGLTIEQVDDFLYARHARERNENLSAKNVRLRENEGSGMTTEEADEILANLDSEGLTPALEKVADRVDAITRSTRRMLVAEGLETQARVQSWEKLYQHYVPLRGFSAEYQGDTESMLPPRGRGFHVKGGEKRAFGRRSRASSPLTNVVAAYEATAVRAEKAKVGRKILRLVQSSPNERVWEINRYEEKPRDNPATGMVEYVSVPPDPSMDNVLSVRVDGRDVFITFHGERGHHIAKAMKNLGAQEMGPLTRGLATLNRWLSLVNTGANPEFVMSNFARDIQTAAINLSGTEAETVKGKILWDTPAAVKGIYMAIVHGNDTDQWSRYYREFEAAGGKTGYVDTYRSIDDAGKKVEREFSRLTRDVKKPKDIAGIMGDAWLSGIHWIENANIAVENGVRLSSFIHAREAGATTEQAANLAKNLTVNFNRKGEWGPQLNAWYLFYNASLQGGVRIAQAMKSKKARRAAYGIMVIAAMREFLNHALGGEDEYGNSYYSQLPRWVRDRNMVFMVPWTEGNYFTIPLPYGYNVLDVAGQEIGRFAAGISGQGNRRYEAEDAADGLVRILAVTVDSFNPIGTTESLLQFLSPTFMDPLAQIAENEDWSGRPVYPKGNPFDEAPTPMSHRSYPSTTTAAKATAEGLNALGGGNAVRPGEVLGVSVDVPPDALDLLFEYATGGAGRIISETVDSGMKLTRGEDIPTYRIPFLGKVWGEAGMRATADEFYENMQSVAYAQKELEHFREVRDRKEVSRVRLEYKAEIRLGTAKDQARDKLSDLRERETKIKTRKDMSPDRRRAALDRIQNERERTMRRFNARYRSEIEKVD